VISPITGQAYARVTSAEPEDLDCAAAAARRAFELDHTPARATGPLVELYRRMCAA